MAVTRPPMVAGPFWALKKYQHAGVRLGMRPGKQEGITPCGMADGAEGSSSVEEAFIELANKLAEAAAEITVKYFRCATARSISQLARSTTASCLSRPSL